VSLSHTSTCTCAFIYDAFSSSLLLLGQSHGTVHMYSVQSSFCFQRGHFKVEHCGGDDHEKQYVHSNLFFLLSLVFLSTRQSQILVRSHRFFVFFLYFPQCLTAVASDERCVVDNGHGISRQPPAPMVGTVVATRAVTWHNPN